MSTFRKRSAEIAQVPDANLECNLEDAWARVLASLDEASVHDQFLSLCAARVRLPYAAARYKELLAANPGHAAATGARQKLIGLMVAVGTVSLAATEREIVRESDVNRIGPAILGFMSVAVTFSIKTYAVGLLLFVGSLAWAAWSVGKQRSARLVSDAQRARRRRIGSYIVIADMLYSAFVIIQELKSGRAPELSFMVIGFSITIYLVFVMFHFLGPDSQFAVSNVIHRRRLRGGE